MSKRASPSEKPALPRRLLIANRGEIALRVARTARRLGLEVLGIFSSADAGLPHLRLCHRALELPGDPKRVYLDMHAVIDAARKLGADAVHPGYGFLSENGGFAAAVEDAGMLFVGPAPEQSAALGDKLAGRKAAQKAGVPTVPGTLEPVADPKEAARIAKEIGFPVLIKASAGGGGRGMRVVENEGQLAESIARAQSEALAAFGDGRVFIEKYFSSVRHVEIQVLGDGKGHAVSLGERDCSVQRRHQKLIEESPTLGMPPEAAKKMGELAAKLAASVHYRGAGTLEFLVPSGKDAKPGEFYFIEVNARLQVEHPVTELRTGLDLVEEQLRIAGGLGYSFDPKKLEWRGHSIEARVIAEDPGADFRPSLGKLETVVLPSGPGVRVDAWAEAGLEVSPHYDSLLAKVLAWGQTRDEAIGRLAGALRETFIAPVTTTAAFIADVIESEPFKSGAYDTSILAARKKAHAPDKDRPLPVSAGVLAAADRLSRNGHAAVPALNYRGRGLSAWQAAERTEEGA
ncbi:MAG: ATP-grasp domain-containing protein [Planctomycetota bacterium]|nr:ATP-grasp domain-containing protein [Planctomycetota bacterium]